MRASGIPPPVEKKLRDSRELHAIAIVYLPWTGRFIMTKGVETGRANAPPPQRAVRKRTRVAYHEAGHAVLSAAINDSPRLVSIRPHGESLGRSRYRFEAPPQRLVQVHLAGFAAEELLTGRRGRRMLGPEMGFSVVALTNPAFASVAEGLETCDQYLAVDAIIRFGRSKTREPILAEVEAFYIAAKESLLSVWPAVRSVARALLKRAELDRASFHVALGEHDIYGPVFDVQERHGIKGWMQ